MEVILRHPLLQIRQKRCNGGFDPWIDVLAPAIPFHCTPSSFKLPGRGRTSDLSVVSGIYLDICIYLKRFLKVSMTRNHNAHSQPGLPLPSTCLDLSEIFLLLFSLTICVCWRTPEWHMKFTTQSREMPEDILEAAASINQTNNGHPQPIFLSRTLSKHENTSNGLDSLLTAPYSDSLDRSLRQPMRQQTL